MTEAMKDFDDAEHIALGIIAAITKDDDGTNYIVVPDMVFGLPNSPSEKAMGVKEVLCLCGCGKLKKCVELRSEYGANALTTWITIMAFNRMVDRVTKPIIESAVKEADGEETVN